MRRELHVISILALLLLIAGLLSGCPSKKQVDGLSQQVEALTAENQSLKQQKEQLEQDKTKLLQQINNKDQEIQTLKAKIDQLEKQINALEELIKAAQAEPEPSQVSTEPLSATVPTAPSAKIDPDLTHCLRARSGPTVASEEIFLICWTYLNKQSIIAIARGEEEGINALRKIVGEKNDVFLVSVSTKRDIAYFDPQNIWFSNANAKTNPQGFFRPLS